MNRSKRAFVRLALAKVRRAGAVTHDVDDGVHSGVMRNVAARSSMQRTEKNVYALCDIVRMLGEANESRCARHQ